VSSRAIARWGWIVIGVLSVGCIAASLLLPYAYAEPRDNAATIDLGPGFYLLIAGFALPWAAWLVWLCRSLARRRTGVGPRWQDWQESDPKRSQEE